MGRVELWRDDAVEFEEDFRGVLEQVLDLLAGGGQVEAV